MSALPRSGPGDIPTGSIQTGTGSGEAGYSSTIPESRACSQSCGRVSSHPSS